MAVHFRISEEVGEAMSQLSQIADRLEAITPAVVKLLRTVDELSIVLIGAELTAQVTALEVPKLPALEVAEPAKRVYRKGKKTAAVSPKKFNLVGKEKPAKKPGITIQTHRHERGNLLDRIVQAVDAGMTTLDEIAGHAESTRASVQQIIGKIIKSGAIACVRRGSKAGPAIYGPAGSTPEPSRETADPHERSQRDMDVVELLAKAIRSNQGLVSVEILAIDTDLNEFKVKEVLRSNPDRFQREAGLWRLA